MVFRVILVLVLIYFNQVNLQIVCFQCEDCEVNPAIAVICEEALSTTEQSSCPTCATEFPDETANTDLTESTESSTTPEITTISYPEVTCPTCAPETESTTNADLTPPTGPVVTPSSTPSLPTGPYTTEGSTLTESTADTTDPDTEPTTEFPLTSSTESTSSSLIPTVETTYEPSPPVTDPTNCPTCPTCNPETDLTPTETDTTLLPVTTSTTSSSTEPTSSDPTCPTCGPEANEQHPTLPTTPKTTAGYTQIVPTFDPLSGNAANEPIDVDAFIAAFLRPEKKHRQRTHVHSSTGENLLAAQERSQLPIYVCTTVDKIVNNRVVTDRGCSIRGQSAAETCTVINNNQPYERCSLCSWSLCNR
ncbi:mucin-2-like isoform X2 [Wyeomyia smithii]|uniref:mucin-2-like isoform X2 n=1 Tax=Wyeomyia smithii TaxID=174621 RepID=UPI002467C775|nr:mucin-2-like isoform X2 [Wyeomyia smithii]